MDDKNQCIFSFNPYKMGISELANFISILARFTTDFLEEKNVKRTRSFFKDSSFWHVSWNAGNIPH